MTTDDCSVMAMAVELGPLAVDVANMLVGGLASLSLSAVFQVPSRADVISLSTDLQSRHQRALRVLPRHTGQRPAGRKGRGADRDSRHRAACLVVDDHLRPLFAFMRAVTVPTAVFAAAEDWADPALTSRLRRAVREVTALHRPSLASEVHAHSWSAYEHSYTSAQAQHRGPGAELDFDTPLMRLAAGGP
jgi:FMN reductase